MVDKKKVGLIDRGGEVMDFFLDARNIFRGNFSDNGRELNVLTGLRFLGDGSGHSTRARLFSGEGSVSSGGR